MTGNWQDSIPLDPGIAFSFPALSLGICLSVLLVSCLKGSYVETWPYSFGILSTSIMALSAGWASILESTPAITVSILQETAIRGATTNLYFLSYFRVVGTSKLTQICMDLCSITVLIGTAILTHFDPQQRYMQNIVFSVFFVISGTCVLVSLAVHDYNHMKTLRRTTMMVIGCVAFAIVLVFVPLVVHDAIRDDFSAIYLILSVDMVCWQLLHVVLLEMPAIRIQVVHATEDSQIRSSSVLVPSEESNLDTAAIHELNAETQSLLSNFVPSRTQVQVVEETKEETKRSSVEDLIHTTLVSLFKEMSDQALLPWAPMSTLGVLDTHHCVVEYLLSALVQSQTESDLISPLERWAKASCSPSSESKFALKSKLQLRNNLRLQTFHVHTTSILQARFANCFVPCSTSITWNHFMQWTGIFLRDQHKRGKNLEEILKLRATIGRTAMSNNGIFVDDLASTLKSDSAYMKLLDQIHESARLVSEVDQKEDSKKSGMPGIIDQVGVCGSVHEFVKLQRQTDIATMRDLFLGQEFSYIAQRMVVPVLPGYSYVSLFAILTWTLELADQKLKQRTQSVFATHAKINATLEASVDIELEPIPVPSPRPSLGERQADAEFATRRNQVIENVRRLTAAACFCFFKHKKYMTNDVVFANLVLWDFLKSNAGYREQFKQVMEFKASYPEKGLLGTYRAAEYELLLSGLFGATLEEPQSCDQERRIQECGRAFLIMIKNIVPEIDRGIFSVSDAIRYWCMETIKDSYQAIDSLVRLSTAMGNRLYNYQMKYLMRDSDGVPSEWTVGQFCQFVDNSRQSSVHATRRDFACTLLLIVMSFVNEKEKADPMHVFFREQCSSSTAANLEIWTREFCKFLKKNKVKKRKTEPLEEKDLLCIRNVWKDDTNDVKLDELLVRAFAETSMKHFQRKRRIERQERDLHVAGRRPRGAKRLSRINKSGMAVYSSAGEEEEEEEGRRREDDLGAGFVVGTETEREDEETLVREIRAMEEPILPPPSPPEPLPEV